ncbi:MAG: AAA family ATPase, partial [Tissierellia bacterium]|nr:AAA family ATPase [Tissierellia bacterium]
MMSLQNHPRIRVVGIATNKESLIERASSMKADAILMEFSLIDTTATIVAKELKDLSIETCVFAISSFFSEQFIFETKFAGVIEVFKRENLVPRDVAEFITNYIDRQRLNLETTPKNEKMVTEHTVNTIKQAIILTCNIKGGVGKTTIATNLGIALKKSPFISSQRIAIVDFDCNGANLSTVYNISDQDALAKNLLFWRDIYEDATVDEVDSMMIEGPHGLMVLPAPVNLALAQQVDYELANKVLNILKKHFDIIIIDGAPNLSVTTDVALQHATHVLLIVNSERQSVKQLTRIVDLLRIDPIKQKKFSHILQKMFVVLNQTQPEGEWDLNAIEISRTIGRPLLGEIPFSESVKEALHGDSGKQAIEIDENNNFSIQIKKIANDICGAYPDVFSFTKNVKKTKSKKSKGKKSKSLLARLLESDI